MPGGLGVIGSEGSVFEYQDGSDWKFVPGISSWTESGGEAPTRDVAAFEGVGSKTGRQRPQTIECEVSAYMPNHPGWRFLRAAAIAKTVIRVRLTSTEEIIYSQATGKTVAIPEIAAGAEGVVTVAGDGDFDPVSSSFAPGMELQTGAEGSRKNYTIQYILGINDNSDEQTGLAEGTPWRVEGRNSIAVAEETAEDEFRVVIPSLRRGPFAAEIVTIDNSSMAAEGDLSSGLTLRPKSILPAWAVV